MTAGSLSPTTLTMRGPCPVQGKIRVPGDKSISHRALLLSALAAGTSTIGGLSHGDDVARTRRAVETLGARIEDLPDGRIRVRGGELAEPSAPLDHGNSGTGIRLTAGVVSGLDVFAVLTGDEFLRQRPMGRVATPLRQMGARIDGRRDGALAPLAIRGGGLRGIEYQSPVASAQVKSAILLAGLSAAGPVTVVEPVATRRHTEEMLRDFGADVTIDGLAVTVAPGPLRAADLHVPGDPSQAAFWVVAGLVAADAEVVVEDLYLGFGRTGFVDVLRQMAAPVEADESAGILAVRRSSMRGMTLAPENVASFIDEVPILAVAAAVARGTTVFQGIGELRFKESDRIASTVAMLRAFGVAVEEMDEGMVVEGGRGLRGGAVDSQGDHRIAMAAAVAGLVAEGDTTIAGWESVTTSYPGFDVELNRLTGGSSRAVVSPADE
jgi:3-phosphoshikimate 1-carboxyvinyltransferase